MRRIEGAARRGRVAGEGFPTPQAAEAVAAVENDATAQETLRANRERCFPALAEDAIFDDLVSALLHATHAGSHR